MQDALQGFPVLFLLLLLLRLWRPTEYIWVKNEPWTMQPNVSICSWLSPSVLSTLSLNNGECNFIDIHPCNSLVRIEKNLKLQMPSCIPLKDKTGMIKDKTLLSIVPGSTKKSNTILLTAFSFRCWIRTKLVVWLALESFYCSVDHRRPLHNRRCIWQKNWRGSEPRKPRSLKSGGGAQA